MRFFAFLLVLLLLTACNNVTQVHIDKPDFIVAPEFPIDTNLTLSETRLVALSLLSCEDKFNNSSRGLAVLRFDNNQATDTTISYVLLPRLQLKIGQEYKISLFMSGTQLASSVLDKTAVKFELICD